LLYDQYENEWDSEHSHRPVWHRRNGNHSPRYVAIKKIYVTSSPVRIYNELELLYHLRQAEDVCPLITAFRHQDQVIAVLPYFQHQDFRDYYRDMTVADMRLYFRSLFNGLAFVHKKRIIHRDIKPTNFLYNPVQNRGVLVDFGLAEHAGTDYQPCLCENLQSVRHEIVGHSAHARGLYDKLYEAPAFPKPDRDTRPSKRANRAGTRGFRAPEVLFKCTAQGTGIDVWSAGVMLLTLLARRFPFFNSTDDVDALLELTQIFGRERMREAALLHGSVFETNIPSYSEKGHSLERVVMWANPLCKRVEVDRDGRRRVGLGSDEQEAVAFLHQCLDLDPAKRISAREAMKHRFITSAGMGLDSDDTVDLVCE
jgi:cell division control protein 7